MRKNKLIEALQAIPGNPDIYVWNGLVDDWMDIKLDSEPIVLVKESVEFIEDQIKREEGDNQTPEEIKKAALLCFKRQKWEFPNQYLDLKNWDRWYGKNQKRVYLIEPKIKNATYSDRLGNIDY